MKTKMFFAALLAGLMCSAQVSAVTAREVCGQFHGDLNIAGTMYSGKNIYLLPGAVSQTVTFVLPDFSFNAGKLGNIVLPNIPMDETGMLTLENATLYLDSIQERATITVLNGLEDEGVVYNSVVSDTAAQVLLSIEAGSLPEPILVLFQGVAVNDRNYFLPNGGFEGTWTNYEPKGWHSFYSATGLMVEFIKNNKQFVASGLVRPGSKGTQSALLSSDLLFGVRANGNCTNGQINAGSMTADDKTANYNFSDPANSGFNTPFHGRPDSIVFWAKYLPADRNAANEVNKARLNAVITTDARYQDPEESDRYGDIKIGSACINYSATSSMGWQRIAVPFTYYAANADKQPAYILATFSTNMQPGGGSSYSTGGSMNKVNILDSVYLDDVQMIYNKQLTSFAIDGEAQTFVEHIATLDEDYCDDCARFVATADGNTASTFIAFDAEHRCIFIYVIADDYAQSGTYRLYRVEFNDSETSDLLPIEPDPDSDYNPEDALETLTVDGRSYEKVIRNGHLLIRHGNSWYTVTGLRIR